MRLYHEVGKETSTRAHSYSPARWTVRGSFTLKWVRVLSGKSSTLLLEGRVRKKESFVVAVPAITML